MLGVHVNQQRVVQPMQKQWRHGFWWGLQCLWQLFLWTVGVGSDVVLSFGLAAAKRNGWSPGQGPGETGGRCVLLDNRMSCVATCRLDADLDVVPDAGPCPRG